MSAGRRVVCRGLAVELAHLRASANVVNAGATDRGRMDGQLLVSNGGARPAG